MVAARTKCDRFIRPSGRAILNDRKQIIKKQAKLVQKQQFEIIGRNQPIGNCGITELWTGNSHLSYSHC